MANETERIPVIVDETYFAIDLQSRDGDKTVDQATCLKCPSGKALADCLLYFN